MNANALDLTVIPREIRDDLARPLAILVADYFEKPGVEDAFQAWLMEYKKRKKGGERDGNRETDSWSIHERDRPAI